MNRLFSLFLLFCISGVQASSLSERIESFKQSLIITPFVAEYDIRDIQTHFPVALLSPESLLPQTSRYPLADLQTLYALSKTCKGPYPLSPAVTEPLAFERALCRNMPLPIKWFARSHLIHPGGGSYAARYVQHFPEQSDALSAFMHIKERPQAPIGSLLYRLQNLSYEGIMALISGSETILQGEELWLKVEGRYQVYSAEQWQIVREQAQLTWQPFQADQPCYVKSGNLCWEEEQETNWLFYGVAALILLNILVLISWGVSRWRNKREELRNRMLVLQILTHELRTPIASLALTVEGFRRAFEQLPSHVHDEFRRLCEDARRLRQLAEASQDYLQSNDQPLTTEWVPSVATWLNYRYEEEKFDLQINIPEDRAVKVNIYWLGNCIDNLVNNAVKYGQSPIYLDIEISSRKLILKVIDQGQLTQKDWMKLKQPFVSENGLGLGLTIVESMVARMGGTMRLVGPPTTFILEIPCETKIATC